MAIFAVVTMSWNVVFGDAGVFSLGQMAFFAVGGYAAALANFHWGLSPGQAYLRRSDRWRGRASDGDTFPLFVLPIDGLVHACVPAGACRTVSNSGLRRPVARLVCSALSIRRWTC